MNISYTSKSFSLRHCEEYKLSIQANLNGFSFCVYDAKRKVCQILKHYSIDVNEDRDYFIKKVREIVEGETLFTKKFLQVNFQYITQNCTIIPDEILKEQDLKQYLSFQHEVHEYDELHYNNLKLFKSYVIYSMPSELSALLLKRFNHVNFFNQSFVLIRLAHDIQVKKNLQDLCLIHKSEKFFDVVIYKNSKLELCNSFNYTSSNDLVYYFISTLRKLRLLEGCIPVFYSGIPEEGKDDILMLERFVEVFKLNEPYQINKENNLALFKKYPIYYFTPLYFLNF